MRGKEQEVSAESIGKMIFPRVACRYTRNRSLYGAVETPWIQNLAEVVTHAGQRRAASCCVSLRRLKPNISEDVTAALVNRNLGHCF